MQIKIGLIARADATGLGIQSKEFYDHIPCQNVLLIDSSKMPGAIHIHRPDFSRYNGAEVHLLRPGPPVNQIPWQTINNLLTDIDILFAMETPYDYNIFRAARERGVKTILQFNYEFLDYPAAHILPDMLAAPSTWNYDLVMDRGTIKKLLPVPVNTKKFTPQRKPRTFIHIVGRPAFQDRNGTQLFLRALQYVKQDVRVIVRSQQPIPTLLTPPSNVELITDFDSKENYADNYTGGVLVLPRKYGGLSLPFNEALAAEMPIITTDISPNNHWLPKEWLVPAAHAGTFQSKKRIDFYDVDVLALASKIDEFCDESFYDAAIVKAREIKETISWDALLPVYEQTFRELIS